MISAGLFVDDDVLSILKSKVTRSPGLFRESLIRQIRGLESEIRRELAESEPTNLPTLPFVWSTDPAKQARARRWYFANKVKGNAGGRYKRTGQLLRAYQVVSNINKVDGLIQIANPAKGAEYVIGNQQVPSHTDTGWPQIDDIALRYSEVINDNIINLWLFITD